MYILNIASAIKKMTINELRDFICDNYYKGIGFAKENSYYSMKHQNKKDIQLFATKLRERKPDPSNAKEYKHAYLKTKKHKISKTIKNN